MKNIILLSLALIALKGYSQTPAHRTCGTADYVMQLQQNDPDYLLRRQQIENFTNEWAANHNPQEKTGVINIPVVIHVVYNTNEENISDAQVLSQIPALNADFRRLNADAVNTPAVWQTTVAADTKIEFCLASVDPNGNLTTGITRTNTNTPVFTMNDNVKFTANGGQDGWPRDSYLNIWVCNLSNGLLGYTTPPGGPANTDGVVIGYKYFGTEGTLDSVFNKGRTATHEIGHWLNLEHIWGDDGVSCNGSDQVSDTPNQSSENYGCPTFPLTDACSPGSIGVMFMNYMDYTNDACMNLFTYGQRTRMIAALNGPRLSIQSSTGCGIEPPPPPICHTATDTLSNTANTDTLVTYNAYDGGTFAGFISGTNVFGDNAKADKFISIPTNYAITGGIAFFSKAYALNSIQTIAATIWDASGTNGSPGNEMASTDLLISSINEGEATPFYFEWPGVVLNSAFMGFSWPGLATTDSVALLTNQNGDSNPNTAWERRIDNTWHEYTEPDGWNMSLSHAIYPILCLIGGVGEENWLGVSVYPNPTNGDVNVYLKLKDNSDVKIRVFNSMGQIINTINNTNTSGNNYNLNLNGNAAGLYFIEVSAGGISRVFKTQIVK